MSNRYLDQNLETIWRFIRGDTPTSDFEQWVYGENALENMLGSELYLHLISANFQSKESVHEIKASLREFAEQLDISSCHCVCLPNTAVVDMGEHGEIFKSLERFTDRGEPYWWLSVYHCGECDTNWLVAQEERQNDVFCLRRLTPSEAANLSEQNSWPKYFDRYETLLQIGRDAGRSVTFVDPLNSSLRYTVIDLATEHPGIRISELAALLNIEPELAESLARQAVADEGVKINFDTSEDQDEVS